jgi:hypothetical protein
MARKGELTAEAARAELFERLRAAKATVVRTTAADTDIDPVHIEPAFEHVLDLVAVPIPTPEQIARWRDEGVRLARAGAATERVLDGYLSLNWALWEVVMQQKDIEREVILEFADRLLRGLDDAVAAIAEGYVHVEVELAAAHSHERRAVLEELLTAPRTTPEDRARIRRRGERHGLSPDDTYRLIVVHAPDRNDEQIEVAVEALEKRIRAPHPHHHTKPGIRLPVVLDWRGRILIFAVGSWIGEKRLREALRIVLGEDLVAVDTGPVATLEALADALTQAEYSATVADSLGRRGWFNDPGQLALESTFLLDDELVRSAVERELGPLLADVRMGEELIETLEVFLGSRQNIRETARRLHLAPRTVAYRLARIETLLGQPLDGDAAVRLSAAVLALRVNRQAGRWPA